MLLGVVVTQGHQSIRMTNRRLSQVTVLPDTQKQSQSNYVVRVRFLSPDPKTSELIPFYGEITFVRHEYGRSLTAFKQLSAE